MSAAANKKLVQQVYTDSAQPQRDHVSSITSPEDATWIVTGQYSWSARVQRT